MTDSPTLNEKDTRIMDRWRKWLISSHQIMVVEVLSRKLLRMAFVVLLILLAGAYYTSIMSTHMFSWRSGEQGNSNRMVYKAGIRESRGIDRFCDYP